LKTAATTVAALSGCARDGNSAADTRRHQGAVMGTSTQRMPVVFVGHGSPMNAIEDNSWSRAFKALGGMLPTPRAVLAVSAHWYVAGTAVTSNAQPKTIHDFGGFPDALFRVQYPAPGDGALAGRVVELLGQKRATQKEDWGLDHGTWSVTLHLWPKANIPVVQLSIDQHLAPEEHVALGRALQPLRDEGVMILGSGNITHNLRAAFGAMRSGDTRTPAWAAAYDHDVTQALEQHDGAALARLLRTPTGTQAHPSEDHYLPLLYAAGASTEKDTVKFPITGFDMGSLSMRAVVLG